MIRRRCGLALALAIGAGVAMHAQTLPPERALARDILQQLVAIPTTADEGTTPRAAQALADRLIAAGFPAGDVHAFGPNPRTGVLVARLRGRAAGRASLLLMAHLDVVPARREDWSADPWTLLERDGWLYGRGTVDDKDGATMLVANLIRLQREGWVPPRDVVIALTGDEETSSASMQWLLDAHRDLIDAEMALNTDAGSIIVKQGKPSVFGVQASEKMYADYQLEVTDVGGHSSLPRPGNPIYTLSAALQRIAAYRFPLDVTDVVRVFFQRSASVESGQMAADMRAVASAKPDAAAADRLSAGSPLYNALLHTTCVATRLDGGQANNALPQSARAVINCRIVPTETTAIIEQTLRRLAGERVTVKALAQSESSPPSPVPPALLDRLDRLVSAQWPGLPVIPYMETGATDGHYTRRAGIPTYGVSAVFEDPDDDRMHGKDERIGVDVFYGALEFWYRMIKALA